MKSLCLAGHRPIQTNLAEIEKATVSALYLAATVLGLGSPDIEDASKNTSEASAVLLHCRSTGWSEQSRRPTLTANKLVVDSVTDLLWALYWWLNLYFPVCLVVRPYTQVIHQRFAFRGNPYGPGQLLIVWFKSWPSAQASPSTARTSGKRCMTAKEHIQTV